MKNQIDKISISNRNITEETVLFYRKLGLSASLDNYSLELISSKDIQIKAYNGKILKLAAKKSIFEDLKKSNGSIKRGDKIVMYDSVGTKITIYEMRMKPNITIGILTSGGDSPGMNSAIKTIVRSSIKNNIKVYGIYKGYEGLITGDIRRLTWNTRVKESGQSGTYLLTARSTKFKTREGMKQAALNLLKRGVNSLIVIGGDGSMEGAMLFKNRYRELCEELAEEGVLSKLEIKHQESFILNIVGIPGTIDNDIIGTEFTLGSDTAINRILETCIKLNSTIQSRKRIFILECMGRDCGWITLMAGFACAADYVFIPESPQVDWKGELIKSVKTAYYSNKLSVFIFLCEGSIDTSGQKIALKDVQNFIKSEGFIVRSLVLGHVQRGGISSAKDRLNGIMSGLKAVEYLSDSENPKIPIMVANINDAPAIQELEYVIKQNRLVKALYKEKRFQEIFKLRGKNFADVFNIFETHRKNMILRFCTPEIPSCQNSQICKPYKKIDKKIKRLEFNIDDFKISDTRKGLRIGVLCDGIRTPGMDAVLNSLVQYGLALDHEVFYFMNGYRGLDQMQVRKARINEFCRFNESGGASIGTSNIKDINPEMIRNRLEALQLDYFIVIGGVRNLKLAKAVNNMIIIPCCIENNFPCTNESIGTDTALNAIAFASESLQLTSFSSKRSISVMEINDENCGYLTILGGIISGAFWGFYPEDCNLNTMKKIRKKILQKFMKQNEKAVILFRNGSTFDRIPVESICKLLTYNTDISYSCCILGDLGRGIFTNPRDIIKGKILAFKALEICKNKSKSGIIGSNCLNAEFIDINQALECYAYQKNTEASPEWVKFAKIFKILEQ